MVCTTSCLIASVFLIGMIYSTNATHKSEIVKRYKAQLPEDLRIRYEKITSERKQIYYHGYIAGLILSLLLIYLNVRRRVRMSTSSLICTILAVSFLTNYFYYLLSPKSDWMLNHIKRPEQTPAWLYMYRNMQWSYPGGLALGLISVGILGYAFRCE
mgnify:CR=1 FL=1